MAIKMTTKNSSFDGKLQFPLNTTRLCDGRWEGGGSREDFDTIQSLPTPPLRDSFFKKGKYSETHKMLKSINKSKSFDRTNSD